MHRKTCLITGATSGLGKELSKNLSNLDYKLILIGKTKSKINNLRKYIGRRGFVQQNRTFKVGVILDTISN